LASQITSAIVSEIKQILKEHKGKNRWCEDPGDHQQIALYAQQRAQQALGEIQKACTRTKKDMKTRHS
jgi:hypothetical protein